MHLYNILNENYYLFFSEIELVQPVPQNHCLSGNTVQKNGTNTSTQTLDSMDDLLNNKDNTL